MLTAPPTDADAAIAMLLADPRLAPLIVAHRELEPRPPRHAPWPEDIDPRVVAALKGRGIDALYTHQAAAYGAASAGRNLVVVTPTASGKTLCYNLPVLDRVLREPEARALYLFPTKALSQDQVAELGQLIELTGAPIRTFTYDGDTPPAARTTERTLAGVSPSYVCVFRPISAASARARSSTSWSAASALVGNR